MKKLISLILIIVIYGCGLNGSKKKPLDETVLIDFSKELNKVNFSDLISDDFKVVQLESTDESLIGQVNKVLIQDGYIFVFDWNKAKSIFMFSDTGKFIRKIGKFGPGPEELGGPIDFFIEDNLVYILDMGINIKIIDFDGNFVESQKINSIGAVQFIKLNGNEIFGFISGNGKHNLEITDGDFNVLNSYFPYQNRDIDLMITNPLYRSDFDNKTVYRRNLNDTLFQITPEGTLLPYRFFDFGEKSIRNTLINPASDTGEAFQNKIKFSSQIMAYYESNSYGFLAFAKNQSLQCNQTTLHIDIQKQIRKIRSFNFNSIGVS
jgi:hypothetical protein